MMTDPVEDAEKILRDYQAWCYKLASDMTGPGFVDDLAQEGLLAMWKALQTFDPAKKGVLTVWLKEHARWRMREVTTGRGRLTGEPAKGGRGRLSSVREDHTAPPVDTTPQPGVPEHEPLHGSTPAPLEDYATAAYHRGQIVEAINRLPPAQREYVYLRFWRDYRPGDMKARFGYDPLSGMWNNPRHGAKTRLRDALAHLDSARAAA